MVENDGIYEPKLHDSKTRSFERDPLQLVEETGFVKISEALRKGARMAAAVEI